MPAPCRREQVLKAFRASLQEHNTKGGNVKQWRTQSKLPRFPVCTTAVIALTGLNAWMLQQAKAGAIHGQFSTLSAHEVGLHASNENQYNVFSYLSARQWLAHSAATHAEQSPMDDKAYLPSRKMCSIIAKYRRDMIARGAQHGNAIKEAGHGTPERPTGAQMSTPRHGCKRPRPVNRTEIVNAGVYSTAWAQPWPRAAWPQPRRRAYAEEYSQAWPWPQLRADWPQPWRRADAGGHSPARWPERACPHGVP